MGVFFKMTKDEMKDRISMALKDPVLQQGFEIICKENAELERKLEQTEKDLADYQFNYPTIKELQKENAELKTRDCWKSCEYANPKSELIGQHIKDVQNLTKAKEIIRELLNSCFGYNSKTVNYEVKVKAEQFLDGVSE